MLVLVFLQNHMACFYTYYVNRVYDNLVHVASWWGRLIIIIVYSFMCGNKPCGFGEIA